MTFPLRPDTKKSVIGIGLGALALVILLYVMLSLWYTDSLRVRERDGFCPTGTWAQKREGIASPGHTVILVDTSNRIPEEDGQRAFAEIESWARNAPLLQKVTVYGLPETEHETPGKIGRSWCVPKQGKTADVLYENPRYVEASFRGVFLVRLRTVFKQLLDREEAPQSPIVETLSFLVDKHDDLNAIVLVSDMLQHSSLASHYENRGNLSETRQCKSIKLDSLRVLPIPRGIRQQQMDWRTPEWQQCFAGVTSVQ